jgi:hypothetical protein
MERTHSASSRKQRRLRRKSRSPNDGTPTEFREAVKAAANAGSDFSAAWRSGTPGTRLAQRKAALELCGWSMQEEDLNGSIRAYVISHGDAAVSVSGAEVLCLAGRMRICSLKLRVGLFLRSSMTRRVTCSCEAMVCSFILFL